MTRITAILLLAILLTDAAIADGRPAAIARDEPREDDGGGSTSAADIAESTSHAQDVPSEATIAETPSAEPSDDGDGSFVGKIAQAFRFLRHGAQRQQRPSRRQPMWFPDWANTNICKVDEGDAPLWMTISPSIWMRETLAECCEDYFGWNYDFCFNFYGDGPPVAQSAGEAFASSWRLPPQHTAKAVPPRRLRGAEEDEELPRHTSQGVPPRDRTRLRRGDRGQRLRGAERSRNNDERESRIGTEERDEAYAYERKASEEVLSSGRLNNDTKT